MHGRWTSPCFFPPPDTPHESEGLRLTHLLDDPLYLLSREPNQSLADHHDSLRVGGRERCRATLVTAYERAGFSLTSPTQQTTWSWSTRWSPTAWGFCTLPGLALQIHRVSGVRDDAAGGDAAGLCGHLRRAGRPAGHLRRGGDPGSPGRRVGTNKMMTRRRHERRGLTGEPASTRSGVPDRLAVTLAVTVSFC